MEPIFVGMEKGRGQFPFDFPVEEIVERTARNSESEKKHYAPFPKLQSLGRPN